MSAGQSAVLAEVPQAETWVAAWRERLDPSAALGVPSHITVLWPFVPAAALTTADVARLRDAVVGSGPLVFSLVAVDEFVDSVWLRPEPAEGFVELTRRVWQAFPDHPPYEGAFDEVVPHLTVAVAEGQVRRRLREQVERELEGALPLPCVVDSVSLWTCGTDERWRRQHVLPLAT